MIKCRYCQHKNPNKRKYCEECGRRLRSKTLLLVMILIFFLLILYYVRIPWTNTVQKKEVVPVTENRLVNVTYDYIEEEFFFESNATAYLSISGMRGDGMLSVLEWTRAPFKSRLLVRRPLNPAKFNGTVIVEWLNVSAGADSDPGFMYNWQEILREGYAYVGVSAQSTGVEGGGGWQLCHLPITRHGHGIRPDTGC